MIAAGCDIGSLTAKAVILRDSLVIGSSILPVTSSVRHSATTILQAAMQAARIRIEEIDTICSTGYGRFENPFSSLNMSEIACHGLGAHHCHPAVRTILDIGGQDCKAIAIDGHGMVTHFVMNEKCAAGTGRCLELLARGVGMSVAEMSAISATSRPSREITNKCTVFMELEVQDLINRRVNRRTIVQSIQHAIARRALNLLGQIPQHTPLCISGGVAKNKGLVETLQILGGSPFAILAMDPQLVGALGAALFALRSPEKGRLHTSIEQVLTL